MQTHIHGCLFCLRVEDFQDIRSQPCMPGEWTWPGAHEVTALITANETESIIGWKHTTTARRTNTRAGTRMINHACFRMLHYNQIKMRKYLNMPTDLHTPMKLIKAFITQYYLIVSSCSWKSGAQEDHILEVKDAERKVEEEDQVMYDCYSISSIQLIILLPFHCSAVNTHPRVALSQRLSF